MQLPLYVPLVPLGTLNQVPHEYLCRRHDLPATAGVVDAAPLAAELAPKPKLSAGAEAAALEAAPVKLKPDVLLLLAGAVDRPANAELLAPNPEKEKVVLPLEAAAAGAALLAAAVVAPNRDGALAAPPNASAEVEPALQAGCRVHELRV